LNSSGEVLAAGDTDVVYGVAGDDHEQDGLRTSRPASDQPSRSVGQRLRANSPRGHP
jgi:hypothetical protein